jgi:hypothetical protein
MLILSKKKVIEKDTQDKGVESALYIMNVSKK